MSDDPFDKLRAFGSFDAAMIFVPVVGSRIEKIELPLEKEGQEEELVVVFAGRGEDVIDLDLAVVHQAPSTKCRVIVRGVLLDQASAKIKGLIRIAKVAQKSDGFLEERTLLVGDRAKVEAQPYLEIEADDVRASHAASEGMVDAEQLFYLRSRGLSEDQALALLIGGFLDQAVANKTDERVASKLEEVKAYLY